MIIRNKGLGLLLVLLLVIGVFTYFKRNTEANYNKSGDENRAIIDTSAIDELTKEAVVVPYVKEHQKLPDYYITKSEARRLGWIASEGNLCNVLPGKAIGGDVFTNREGSLPAGKRKWFEADLNYNCGRRNADRLLFSSDGLIYITYDHYKTFQQR